MFELVALCVSAVVGCAVGLMFGLRHLDRECEKGYLTGHVDGYEKALFDLGEV